MTFAELLDISRDRAAARGCQPATLKGLDYQARRFLKPTLGHVNIADLRPEHFENLYTALRECDISTSTIRKCHSTAHQALKHAERREWIKTNPVRLAELPKHVALEKNWPTVEEVQSFLAVAENRDPEIYDYAYVISATGVRPGEACALMQTDLADGILTVERALDVCQGKARLKCTKTGKSRRFAIDDATAGIIRGRSEPFLFGGFEPERTDLMSKRFKRCAKRAKVRMMPRNLRHFHATQLIAAGIDVKTVADRLGHSNPQTTWAYYIGSVPVKQTVAAETIAKVLPCRKSDRPDDRSLAVKETAGA